MFSTRFDIRESNINSRFKGLSDGLKMHINKYSQTLIDLDKL